MFVGSPHLTPGGFETHPYEGGPDGVLVCKGVDGRFGLGGPAPHLRLV